MVSENFAKRPFSLNTSVWALKRPLWEKIGFTGGDHVIGLEAFVVVRVEVFSFFVVAACALIICLAAARPFLVVDEVCLLLPGLFVGVGKKKIHRFGITAYDDIWLLHIVFFGNRVCLVSAEITFDFIFFRCTHFKDAIIHLLSSTEPNILRCCLPLSWFVLDADGSSECWILQLYSIVLDLNSSCILGREL